MEMTEETKNAITAMFERNKLNRTTGTSKMLFRNKKYVITTYDVFCLMVAKTVDCFPKDALFSAETLRGLYHYEYKYSKFRKTLVILCKKGLIVQDTRDTREPKYFKLSPLALGTCEYKLAFLTACNNQPKESVKE